MMNDEELMRNSVAVRFFGGLSVFIGCGLAYLAIFEPIREAIARTETIHLTTGAAGAAAIMLFGGIIMLVGGNRVTPYLVLNWRTATARQVAGTGIIAAMGIAVEILFSLFLERLGYQIVK